MVKVFIETDEEENTDFHCEFYILNKYHCAAGIGSGIHLRDTCRLYSRKEFESKKFLKFDFENSRCSICGKVLSFFYIYTIFSLVEKELFDLKSEKMLCCKCKRHLK